MTHTSITQHVAPAGAEMWVSGMMLAHMNRPASPHEMEHFTALLRAGEDVWSVFGQMYASAGSDGMVMGTDETWLSMTLRNVLQRDAADSELVHYSDRFLDYRARGLDDGEARAATTHDLIRDVIADGGSDADAYVYQAWAGINATGCIAHLESEGHGDHTYALIEMARAGIYNNAAQAGEGDYNAAIWQMSNYLASAAHPIDDPRHDLLETTIVDHIYAGLLGRPASPDEFESLTNAREAGQEAFTSALNDLSASEEVQQLYSGMSSTDAVSAMATRLFGEDIAPETEEFFARQLDDGSISFAQIAHELSALEYAYIDAESVTYDQSLHWTFIGDAAAQWTRAIDTEQERHVYDTEFGHDYARQWLDGVEYEPGGPRFPEVDEALADMCEQFEALVLAGVAEPVDAIPIDPFLI